MKKLIITVLLLSSTLSVSAFAAVCSNANQSVKIVSPETGKETIYNNANSAVFLNGVRTSFAKPAEIFYSFNHSSLTTYIVEVNKPVLESASESLSVTEVVLCNERLVR